jgi:hypothetical protein
MELGMTENDAKKLWLSGDQATRARFDALKQEIDAVGRKLDTADVETDEFSDLEEEISSDVQ